MKLRPLGDRVVLKRVAAEETKKSGIIDGNEVAMTVKKGDKVITGKYTGTEVKLDGEELTIVKVGDILAIVE